MRQVPHYLIIGNGRVANHFKHYFTLLNLAFSTWYRQQSLAELNNKLNLVASHVLLLINDDAIEDFFIQHLKNNHPTYIHFSGSLVSNHVYGAHPLMSFSEKLYELNHYQSIPFIIDHDAPAFDNLLPGLPNPHVRLHKSLKEKYHALCVLSGNFSCLLWQKLFASFEQEMLLPANIAHPYLLQQTKNLLDNPKTALTGPLVRNDIKTIEKNLLALNNDSFQQIYQSFVTCYQQLRGVI